MIRIKSFEIIVLLSILSFSRISGRLLPSKKLGNSTFSFVDFDVSMGKGKTYSGAAYRKITASKKRTEYLNFFRMLYNRNNVLNITLQPEPKIPKIIHQIWLGPNKPPSQFINKWQKSWTNNHSDWQYVLWTNKDLNKIKLTNQKYFDRARNWGERSDILRYELIYQFGGLYIDIDFECLQPFDILHHSYDFYTGIGPFDSSIFYIGNGLVAARAYHPILEYAIESISKDKNKRMLIQRAGPPHFLRAIMAKIEDPASGIAMALPASYFYPIARDQKRFRNKAKKALLQQESFAVHHWARTWKSPKAYVRRK